MPVPVKLALDVVARSTEISIPSSSVWSVSRPTADSTIVLSCEVIISLEIEGRIEGSSDACVFLFRLFEVVL
jgi:hypothetical protein